MTDLRTILEVGAIILGLGLLTGAVINTIILPLLAAANDVIFVLSILIVLLLLPYIWGVIVRLAVTREVETNLLTNYITGIVYFIFVLVAAIPIMFVGLLLFPGINPAAGMALFSLVMIPVTGLMATIVVERVRG